MSFLCFILIIILPLFLSNSLPHLLKPLNNNRNTPSIIGILTQPSSWLGLFSPNEYSYIASSYIKALEASGAQVLPLKYDWDEAQMDQVFEGINGLLLPGGGTELVEEGEWTHYGRVGSRLIRKAIERNDNMEYFPVWGTCLGFELMVLTIAEDFKVLKKNFNSLNYSNSLQFIEVFLLL